MFNKKGKKKLSSDNSVNIYPVESFYMWESTMVDGKPAIGMFNYGYAHFSLKHNYPWFLKIAIALDLESIDERGLPIEDELRTARELEDELIMNLKKITTVHYIGHLFNDSFLDIFCYLLEPKLVHDWLQKGINNEIFIRGIGYDICEDFEWDKVNYFLGN
ncbi:MAG: DUF695 domain-containing protein [Bacteroidetes bacterium]|nr:DUF695 domain-containing protein [Bacteroidota bacterium]